MVDIWSIDVDNFDLNDIPDEILQGIGEPDDASQMTSLQLRKEVRSIAAAPSPQECDVNPLPVRTLV